MYRFRRLTAALAVLLASGNGRGGGDLRSDSALVGSWAGHRVVLAGDHDDTGLFCEAFAAAVGQAYDPEEPETLHSYARRLGTDVASEVSACFRDAGERLGRLV